MKISKFMLLGTAFTLAVGSLFATKSSKKFTAINTAFAKSPFVGAKLQYIGHLTTVATAGKTAFIATLLSRTTLYTSTLLTNKAYFK